MHSRRNLTLLGTVVAADLGINDVYRCRNLTLLGMVALAVCVGVGACSATATRQSQSAASKAVYRNGDFETHNWCPWDLEQGTVRISPTRCARTFGTPANSGRSATRIVTSPTRGSRRTRPA